MGRLAFLQEHFCRLDSDGRPPSVAGRRVAFRAPRDSKISLRHGLTCGARRLTFHAQIGGRRTSVVSRRVSRREEARRSTPSDLAFIGGDDGVRTHDLRLAKSGLWESAECGPPAPSGTRGPIARFICDDANPSQRFSRSASIAEMAGLAAEVAFQSHNSSDIVTGS